ncbi:unnamed protein product [Sphenostylis stenocarpa]|uniref:Uncharacterized protein n=1 Tax=Sphenostylis stenocarpa TaxID=92480 RepID=A0AA86SJL3_9FABA|nr:unnamed protein product [Sphenostylis stenocarpa]
MPSHSRILNHRHLSLPLHLSRNKRLSLPQTTSLTCCSRSRFGCATLQLHPLIIQQYECVVRRNVFPTRALDDDSFDIPMLDDWNTDESSVYVLSSSDGEDSDGEIFLTPVNDIDLPSVSASNNDALTVAAHRFATLGRGQKKPRQQQGPARHQMKKRTPTLGGLLFVPIGIIVAHVFARSSSIEVSGAAAATIAFAAVGLLSDILSFTNHWRGLPALTEVLLEVAVGTWFSFWLDITSISSPYGMKMLVPLPLGLVYLGRCYQLLTSFSFVSMGHGVKLADALDGLAGGTAALAFIGMSIAVLPVCSDLAIFGASMAGSCVGFLLHNRYKASIFMGHTGSLALGAGLAAMAACTGMFFPLLISSGVFIVESSSVIVQVRPMLEMPPYISE